MEEAPQGQEKQFQVLSVVSLANVAWKEDDK